MAFSQGAGDWTDLPPVPSTAFEAQLLRELPRLLVELPADSARLEVGRVPGHPEWPEPYFEITPKNPRAARFCGVAVAQDLDITIGEAAREFPGFARGGTVLDRLPWQDELRWIWLAVIAGGFEQLHYLDSNGKVIGWLSKLRVKEKEVVFRNGRRTKKLFGHERARTVVYDPYC